MMRYVPELVTGAIVGIAAAFVFVPWIYGIAAIFDIVVRGR